MGSLLSLVLAVAAARVVPLPSADQERVALLARDAADAAAHARYEEALDIYHKAVALMPEGSDDLPPALNNMAEVMRALGRFRDAESLHRRVLAMREARYGTGHEDVAQSLNNLGEVLRDQRRLRAAEDAERRALSIAEVRFGDRHEVTALILTNLGQVLMQQRRLGEAESILDRASSSWDSLGATGTGAAIATNNLAIVYSQTGRRERAEALYLRVRERLTGTLGGDHPYVAAITCNLAQLYRSLHRNADAAREFERALAIYAQCVPDGHPAVTSALAGYAAALRAEGRAHEARVALARSRTLRQEHDRVEGSAWTVDARELSR